MMKKYEQLLKEAEKARKYAYAPYSGFTVGTALLGKNGTIYHGCNIENASYGAANCAERTAFFKAISEGETEFCAIAIIGGRKGESGNHICPPCGICRQVMKEFCDENFEIVLRNGQEIVVKTLKEMYPFGFDAEAL